MEDKKIICKDCGEQEFYKEKGLTNEPCRCKSCRQARKEYFNSKK